MSTSHLIHRAALVPGLLASVIGLSAQTSVDPQLNDDPHVVTLSAFEVDETRDIGYRALNTLGATRANVAIRDLPMNIVVANHELIEDINAFDLSEAITYMGGVARLGGSSEPRYSLRGFTSSAMMRNGIRTFGPSDASPDSVGVDRVEIIKGPAAILYGVSEPGGTINFVTAKPVAGKSFVNASFQGGSFNLFRANFTANSQISEKQPLYFRVDGGYQTQAEGPRFQSKENHAFNTSLSWRPTVNTTVTATHYEMESSLIREGGDPTYRIGSDRLLMLDEVDFDFARFPTWAVQDDSERFTELALTHRFSDRLSVRSFYGRNLSSLSYIQHARGSDVRKANDSNRWSAGEDPTTGFVSRAPITTVNEPNRLGEVFQIDAMAQFETGGLGHQLLIGYENVLQKVTRFNGALFSDDPAFVAAVNDQFSKVTVAREGSGRIIFTSPLFDKEAITQRNQLLTALGGRQLLRESFGSEQKLISESVLLNYQLTFGEAERGRIMAGYRSDDFRSRLTTGAGVTHTQTGGESPQLGVSYRVVPAVTLYSLYSRSITPNTGSQAFAPQITPLADGSPFDPEYGEGFDLGIKFETAEGRFAGTLAFFSVTRENIVRSHPDMELSEAVEAVAGQGLRALSGSEKNEGLEADFVLFPTKNWQVYGGLTLLTNSEVISADDPSIIGMPVQYARDLTLSLWNKIAVSEHIYAAVGLVHMTQPERRDFTNGDSRFTRLDATIGYQTMLSGVDSRFELQVKNLTDEQYYVARAARGYPLQVLLSTKFKF